VHELVIKIEPHDYSLRTVHLQDYFSLSYHKRHASTLIEFYQRSKPLASPPPN